MRKKRPWGLVVTGKLADSTLVHLPVLTDNLGLVVSGSMRLASRYANALRRGRATEDWRELEQTGIVFVQAPEPELNRIVDSLLRRAGDWDRRIAVLLDPVLDSSSLRGLATAGAPVASLTHVPLPGSSVALLEGDDGAMNRLRPVLRKAGIKTIRLRPGAKAAYRGGVELGAMLAGAVTEMALRAVESSGIDPGTARRIVSRSIDLAVRESMAKGRTGWSGAAGEQLKADALAHAAAILERDIAAGRFAREASDAMAEFYMKRRPG